MGVMIDLRAEHLPCGAGLVALLEQVDEGRADQRSAHQAACPYCQAALDEARRALAKVDRAAGLPVAVPSGLVAAVMRRVRAVARGGGSVLRRGGRGVTRISTWALQRIVTRAAAAVPGVRSALGRVSRGVHDQTVRVHLDLVIEYGPPVQEIGAAVRDRVQAALGEWAGVHTQVVDVTVDDVTNPPGHTTGKHPPGAGA